MVTINSALQLGVANRIGSITVGKDADFVIWSDNPLSMYARAEQTWIEGARYYDIQTNDQLVAEIESEKNALIQELLNSGSFDKSKGKNGPPKRRYAPDEEGSEL
jgi:adenine deaminase